jgi:S-adenosylmethionine decarboxylase
MGKHIIIDWKVKKEKLDNLELIYRILDFLPSFLGMRKLTPPFVVVCDDVPKKERGISGFVMIYESHISIHTWPEKEKLSMDIYSCKNFDHKKVITYLRSYFGSDGSFSVIKRK